MIDTIIAAFLGALAMLTWIVLAAYVWDVFAKELKK